jgi:short-subunit dehydrogenase
MLVKISPEAGKIISRMWEKFKPMAPNIFAEKVLNAVAKNKAIIIEPSSWKWVWRINRFFPILGIRLAQKSFQKTLFEITKLSKGQTV